MQYLIASAIFLVVYTATWVALGWLPRAHQSIKCAPLSKKLAPGDRLKTDNGDEFIVVSHDDTKVDVVRRPPDDKDEVARKSDLVSAAEKVKFTKEQEEYFNSIFANERRRILKKHHDLLAMLDGEKSKREAEKQAYERAEQDKIEWQKRAAVEREKADRKFAQQSKMATPFCYWDHETRKFYVSIDGCWKEIAQTDIAAHRSTQWPKQMVWDQMIRSRCFPNSIGVGTGYKFRGAEVVAETEHDYIFDREVKLVDDLQGYVAWRIRQMGGV